jgi:hypothetical protein
MVWARKSAPANKSEPEATLAGVEINATRARAVHGPAQVLPRVLPLAGSADELPMVVSLQGRQAEVGRAGSAICRLLPHLTCSDFLAHLGEPREWTAGRHRLDAAKALTLVFELLQRSLGQAKGIVLAVPAYLTRAQVLLLPSLAEKAGLPLLGTVQTPLVSALAAYRLEPWSGVALVLDIDDHAFTAGTVVANDHQLTTDAAQSWSHLNLRAWKGRLIDTVADRCIRQSRRDPRDTPAAEQALYERIDDALDACIQGKPVEFLMQTARWYQHLLMRPEEIAACCDRLVRQVLQAIQEMLTTKAAGQAPRIVLVSWAAGRLPGLLAALGGIFPQPALEAEASEDFGEDLLQERRESARVLVQAADATAQAAHELAARFECGELSRGHLDFAIPLPRSDPQSAGGDAKKTMFRLLSFDL